MSSSSNLTSSSDSDLLRTEIRNNQIEIRNQMKYLKRGYPFIVQVPVDPNKPLPLSELEICMNIKEKILYCDYEPRYSEVQNKVVKLDISGDLAHRLCKLHQTLAKRDYIETVNKVLELEKLKEFAEKVKRRNQIIKKEKKLYESKAKDYIEEIIYEDHEVGDVQAVAIEDRHVLPIQDRQLVEQEVPHLPDARFFNDYDIEDQPMIAADRVVAERNIDKTIRAQTPPIPFPEDVPLVSVQHEQPFPLHQVTAEFDSAVEPRRERTVENLATRPSDINVMRHLRIEEEDVHEPERRSDISVPQARPDRGERDEDDELDKIRRYLEENGGALPMDIPEISEQELQALGIGDARETVPAETEGMEIVETVVEALRPEKILPTPRLFTVEPQAAIELDEERVQPLRDFFERAESRDQERVEVPQEVPAREEILEHARLEQDQVLPMEVEEEEDIFEMPPVEEAPMPSRRRIRISVDENTMIENYAATALRRNREVVVERIRVFEGPPRILQESRVRHLMRNPGFGATILRERTRADALQHLYTRHLVPPLHQGDQIVPRFGRDRASPRGHIQPPQRSPLPPGDRRSQFLPRAPQRPGTPEQFRTPPRTPQRIPHHQEEIRDRPPTQRVPGRLGGQTSPIIWQKTPDRQDLLQLFRTPEQGFPLIVQRTSQHEEIQVGRPTPQRIGGQTSPLTVQRTPERQDMPEQPPTLQRTPQPQDITERPLTPERISRQLGAQSSPVIGQRTPERRVVLELFRTPPRTVVRPEGLTSPLIVQRIPERQDIVEQPPALQRSPQAPEIEDPFQILQRTPQPQEIPERPLTPERILGQPGAQSSPIIVQRTPERQDMPEQPPALQRTPQAPEIEAPFQVLPRTPQPQEILERPLTPERILGQPGAQSTPVIVQKTPELQDMPEQPPALPRIPQPQEIPERPPTPQRTSVRAGEQETGSPQMAQGTPQRRDILEYPPTPERSLQPPEVELPPLIPERGTGLRQVEPEPELLATLPEIDEEEVATAQRIDVILQPERPQETERLPEAMDVDLQREAEPQPLQGLQLEFHAPQEAERIIEPTDEAPVAGIVQRPSEQLEPMEMLPVEEPIALGAEIPRTQEGDRELHQEWALVPVDPDPRLQRYVGTPIPRMLANLLPPIPEPHIFEDVPERSPRRHRAHRGQGIAIEAPAGNPWFTSTIPPAPKKKWKNYWYVKDLLEDLWNGKVEKSTTIREILGSSISEEGTLEYHRENALVLIPYLSEIQNQCLNEFENSESRNENLELDLENLETSTENSGSNNENLESGVERLESSD